MSNLRDQLISVRRSYGELTPANVVDAARPKDHPLHDRFEWRNGVAAEKYREQQAANLIRSVRIEFTKTDGQKATVRHYVAIREPERPKAYVPVREVIEDPMSTKIMLREMHRDWQAFKRRYGNMKEFVQLIREEAASVAA